jgi:hypothetical protein
MFHRVAGARGETAKGRAPARAWGLILDGRKIKLDDEIETEEQRETFKQTLLRLLDDPQLQQKIGAFLRRSGLARSTGINVPQRWHR